MDARLWQMTLLASVSVNMKTTGKTVLYTVPAGKKAYPMLVVVRDPSASLAGGTDYDFGTGANADTWVQAVDLSSMTGTTDFKPVDAAGAKYAHCAAGSEFGVKVNTGATLDATATIDVFGYLA